MVNPVALDNYDLDIKVICFLDSARNSLLLNDFTVLSQILSEWHSSTTFNQLYSRWETYRKPLTQSSLKFLHTLCFNIRGMDLRWNEVCLLAAAHRFDIMVLGEVDRLDLSLIGMKLGIH
jgi:hypothetical protein